MTPPLNLAPVFRQEYNNSYFARKIIDQTVISPSGLITVSDDLRSNYNRLNTAQANMSSIVSGSSSQIGSTHVYAPNIRTFG